MVVIGDGSGSGFLFQSKGNCFVVLPTHLHGIRFEGIQITEPGGNRIGTAKILYKASDNADLSVGLVRGSITADCGPEWSGLPRRLSQSLKVGMPVTMRRARQASTEGRQVVIRTLTFQQIEIAPEGNEEADLFGGTSGAFLFDGDKPVGMVTDAANAGQAWALRMDEIVNRVSRIMGEMQEGDPCADPTMPGCESGGALPEAATEGKAIEVTSWSVHPVEGTADPTQMLLGQGAYVAPLTASTPIVLELTLPEDDRLRRITILSKPDDAASVPRGIEISTDATDGAVRRPSPFPSYEMSPDGIYDVKVQERFVKRLTIKITSTWGGGSPARIDSIVVE
ncbi:hypothetical protein [Maritimibacter sp. DP1N21-5]|uniref:hypothetical protein n=1 Tax=Maritimibacter sp. DP1N21-5 TaxID=2836867 RepID=UPI001C45765D|nr:hypothetical protein [Maritimibacter sp. DP1N21-5]MBV7408566.1 hypothetical protein [Maritimibacter sp. DP1N21-5]